MASKIFGLARWALRPIDIAVRAAETIVGTGFALKPLYAGFQAESYTASEIWSLMSAVPRGREAFSSYIGLIAPYSSSIGATVLSLSPASCKASLAERPWLGNPYESIHALALANLGELTSGLAATANMQETQRATGLIARGIPVRISTEYFKKSRGTITATCDLAKFPTLPGVYKNVTVIADLHNEQGEKVATFSADWHVTIESKPAKQSHDN